MPTPLRSTERPSALTLRQRQVITLIGQHMQTRDIATALGIASATVDKHRNHITQKLHLSNTAQLTAYCVQVVQHAGRTMPTPCTPRPDPDRPDAATMPTTWRAKGATTNAARPQTHQLALREWQILQLLASGMTTKEMARQLSLSPRTISEHRRRLMRRFSVHRMVELMTLYTRIVAKDAD